MPQASTRRKFLKLAGQGLLVAPATATLLSGSAAANPTAPPAPVAPALRLSVRDFGATGDGITKDTAALQQALDRCWVLGGGEVLVPAGTYLTGAIALRSQVLLRLEKDAILLGSPDLADYPVQQVRWEGKWVPGHLGLVYSLDAHATGVVGPGSIRGGPGLGGRPTPERPLRRPALIEPIGCTDLRFEDFATDYALMWSLHPTYCERVVIKNLTIRSTGGNGDGIDLDSCQHVRIEGCDISTGDDCISLKSGRGLEGYTLARPTTDVLIRDCTFADSIFACIGIGSETSGGIRGVRIEHCRFTHAQTYAIYIKTRPGRGAFIEDVVVDDIDVAGTVAGFLRFNLLGSGLQDQAPVPGEAGIPTVRNLHFSNVRVQNVPVLVEGTAVHPAKPLQGFTLTNVSGTCAQGIFLANVQQAKLHNLHLTGYQEPLLHLSNVSGSGLAGAASLTPPSVPPPVPEPAQPYKLG
ncbi:MAG: glycoside hydrolase family 28 protein [Janthinobacterium lividum]